MKRSGLDVRGIVLAAVVLAGAGVPCRALPGGPDACPTYYRWLKLCRAMVEPGTRAFIEMAQSDLFSKPPPEGVVVSVFANRAVFLALANDAHQPVTIEPSGVWRSCMDEAAPRGSAWRLEPRTLTVLRSG